jgi:hypothetical protein
MWLEERRGNQTQPGALRGVVSLNGIDNKNRVIPWSINERLAATLSFSHTKKTAERPP